MPTLVALIDARPDRPFWGRSWVESAFSAHVQGYASSRAMPATASDAAVLEGWSVGGCLGAETLVQSRPIARPSDDPVSDLLRAEATCSIGRFHSRPRDAAPGTLEPRTARFRRWMGASIAPGLSENVRGQILSRLPPFLSRDARGQSDAQLLLLATLGELFATTGFRRAYAEPSEVVQALRAVQEAIPAEAPRTLMMADGRTAAVLHEGGCLMMLQPPPDVRPTLHIRPELNAVPACMLICSPQAPATPIEGAERLGEGIYTLGAAAPGAIQRA